MEPNPFPFGRCELVALVPNGVRDAEASEIVHQACAPHSPASPGGSPKPRAAAANADTP